MAPGAAHSRWAHSPPPGCLGVVTGGLCHRGYRQRWGRGGALGSGTRGSRCRAQRSGSLPSITPNPLPAWGIPPSLLPRPPSNPLPLQKAPLAPSCGALHTGPRFPCSCARGKAQERRDGQVLQTQILDVGDPAHPLQRRSDPLRRQAASPAPQQEALLDAEIKSTAPPPPANHIPYRGHKKEEGHRTTCEALGGAGGADSSLKSLLRPHWPLLPAVSSLRQPQARLAGASSTFPGPLPRRPHLPIPCLPGAAGCPHPYTFSTGPPGSSAGPDPRAPGTGSLREELTGCTHGTSSPGPLGGAAGA